MTELFAQLLSSVWPRLVDRWAWTVVCIFALFQPQVGAYESSHVDDHLSTSRRAILAGDHDDRQDL